MKITNNTSQLITLVNGKRLEKFKSTTISEPSQELLIQLENLKNMGLITVLS